MNPEICMVGEERERVREGELVYKRTVPAHHLGNTAIYIYVSIYPISVAPFILSGDMIFYENLPKIEIAGSINKIVSFS